MDQGPSEAQGPLEAQDPLAAQSLLVSQGPLVDQDTWPATELINDSSALWNHRALQKHRTL